MATASSRGTSVVSTVSTTWSSTANAFDGAVGTNPATYATWVNAARSTAGSITIGGYTFGLSGGFTVNSVTAAVRHFESSTTNISNLTAQLQDSAGTNIGTAVAVTRGTTAATTTVTLGTPTPAQVNGGLRVLITANRANNTTSSTLSLDYVDVTVTYTPAPLAETVTDGFATKDTTKWTWKGTASAVNGYANIPCTTAYDGVITNSVLNLVGSSWSAQVLQRHSGSGGSEDLIGMLLSNADINNYEAWLVQGTSLIARERVANVDSQTSTTYDPDVHQYLKVRESGGTVFWDYSADGVNYTNFRSKAAGLTLTAMYGAALSGIFGTDAAPGTLHVDNVNSFTPKFASFTDDFNTQDTSKWTFRNSTVHDGVLDCPPGTGNNFDAYSNGAQGTYDLTASQIVVNIAQMVDPTDQFIWYLSDSSQANTFSFYKYLDGNLYSCERAASVDSNTNPVTWDPVNHKYLRIRESAGTIFWETSPTGLGSWTVQRSKAPAIIITSFFTWLLAAGGGTQTHDLLVDSVNVTPPPPATSLVPPTPRTRPNYGSLIQL